jgi:hypothetical protein
MMTASNQSPPATTHSLLAETLLSVCSAARAHPIVAEALDLAGLPSVPTDLDVFLRFARVELREVLINRLGMDVAEAALDGLENVLRTRHVSGTYSRTSFAKLSLVRKSTR